MTAKEQLTEEEAMWKELAERQNLSNGPHGFQGWLLENGEESGPAIRIRGLPLMKKKQCYSNSLKSIIYENVDPTEWFYTEGVVLTDVPILIDHAWLSNEKGEVLDRTLRSQGKATYFGIPLKRDFAINTTMERGYYGLLLNRGMYNTDIVGQPVGQNRAWPKRETVNEPA